MKIKRINEDASRLAKYAGDHACVELDMYNAIRSTEELKKKIEDRLEDQNKDADEFIKETAKKDEKTSFKPVKGNKGMQKLHLRFPAILP